MSNEHHHFNTGNHKTVTSNKYIVCSGDPSSVNFTMGLICNKFKIKDNNIALERIYAVLETFPVF